jgi:hypothetical protein
MVLRSLECHANVAIALFAADGRHIVSYAHNDTITAWDSQTDERIAGSFEGATEGELSFTDSESAPSYITTPPRDNTPLQGTYTLSHSFCVDNEVGARLGTSCCNFLTCTGGFIDWQ